MEQRSFPSAMAPTPLALTALPRREPLLEISNRMVRLYKNAIGRGPTKCRTQFAGADSLVVLLENSFTVSERTLVALGEEQRLRETRLVLQSTLETDARGIVEEVLARRTLSFITGIDTRRDVTLHFFTLGRPLDGGMDAA
jgi:uncharacterized protein YbcI